MFEPEYHYDPESLPGAEVAERYILKGLREKVNISDDHGEIITDAFADMTMSQGYQITRAFQRRLVPTCEEIIKRTDIIEDLRKRKFDAYISEPLGCDNGFAHLIGISTYIMLTSLPFLDHYTVAMRMPLTASYVPSIIFESYGDEMTYWERVYNWYSTLAGHYNIETSLDDHTQMFRKHFGPAFPSTQSLFQNASLIFVNTDEFVDFPRPTQDNIVNIGGIGLDRKNDTLEEPFKSQARMGKLGSVVITFGTHVPTATLPIAFKRNLVTALVSLPNYHFIVRVDKGDLATMKSWLGGAKNVYFTDWTPQAALLHDTNVVAFVSHMGANSLMEAAYNGKVVLCMPFAFDQNRNCRSAVRNGWAKYFSRTELLDGPDTFKAAIINLLEGESGAGYRANAARVKQLIKNKPLSSEERLRKYIHLLEIADPYRWMENPDSKETKRFIKQLNSMSRPFFEKSYSRDKFREKLTKIYDQKMYGCVSKHGDHYYYFYNSGLQNHSVLYRQHSFDDKEEIFLDPNTLSVDGTTSLSQTSFSRDGKVLAYAISEKGSDITTVKFRDSSGSDLKDTITDVKHTSISWSPKNDGIFYSKYTNHKKASNETDVESDEYHSLFFHRLGSKSDILIADFREFGNPHLAITGSVSADGRFLFVYVYDSKSSNNVYYYDLKSIDYQVHKKLNLTLIFQDPHAFFAVVDYDYETDRALALTNHAAPMWKLIRVKLETAILGCAHWETVIEEDANRTLNAVVPVAGDKLMVQYLEDVKTSLYVHSQKTGELLYSIPLGIGAVSQCYGDKNDTEAFFSFSSFLEPTRFFRVDFSQVEKTDLIKLEEIRRTQFLGVDTSNFVVKQEFYRSKDGTKVPLFIIHNKDIVMDGKNPTILYGYGGFNIPVLPSYSSQRNLFIKHFRGVAAVANIRGGGEYGDKWHERGIREHKQNVFDDFISAAEYLIEKNYTTPKKLAIQGGSNGGLLVAACSQQRPELFGAVINQVGVMDMLRFHKFTVGSSWIYEYGDPDKPIDFEYIYKYSPLHNARLPNGIQWPATLLMTADHDDRVVPSHTLKYIAELYHYFQDPKRKLIQRNPVIAHVETDAGHGAGKSISKSIDESADIMSFLQRVLHMKWYD
ncbi:prolyl oligopeptidase family domain-containing protein [Ditylenchus destructor]|nr:prolyl oligopeptidase family domain-containing protein [Ditylenchus destructor]